MTDEYDDGLNQAYHNSLVRLAEIENDTSLEAALQRVAIYDGQTDFFNGAAAIARDHGNTDAANELESIARECWGKCIEATSDLNEKFPNFEGLKINE